MRTELIDKLLSTRIPGGSEARDWFLPHEKERGLENVREVVRLMLEAWLAQQEPIAWMNDDGEMISEYYRKMANGLPYDDKPLFLAPPTVKQEPASHQYQDRNGQWKDFLDQRHYENTVEDDSWPIRALYTSPPTSPEGWQPIETAPKNQAVFVKLISSDIPYAARFDGECWELTWDGYCLSEFDGPTHWKPLPPPPGEKK